jgi:hypothetical protein
MEEVLDLSEEPKLEFRQVNITDRRTKIEFAQRMKHGFII